MKLYERMVLQGLEAELSEIEGLSIRQFGFRKGMGTTKVVSRVLELVEEGKMYRGGKTCAVISLDVANAFNKALWPAIDETVRKKGFSRLMMRTLRSYMTCREIQVATAEGTVSLGVYRARS